MNSSRQAQPAATRRSRLAQTRAAFDSVAADYDGERGNNAVIQDMRRELWRHLDATFARGSRLIDLGCGTGLDAVRLAGIGHEIIATDWSPAMLERTRSRAQQAGVAEAVQCLNIGAQELQRLAGDGSFDGAYSDLGALNCVPELRSVAEQCARLLKPGAALVFTVIGRNCPWELGYYLLRGHWRRALVRYARGAVPVGMNQRIVWTRYYTPREFYRPFRGYFALSHFRGICSLLPPPYLTGLRRRHRGCYELLWRLERRCAGWPLLRACGDHFLIVMHRR